MNVPPLYIEVPAWGSYYVDLACRFTVPAALEALAESNFRDVTFLVHTDDQASFRAAIGDAADVRFLPLLPLGPIPKDQRLPRLPVNYWDAFKKAHKDAVDVTPPGAIVTLLNSDIVVSRECFSFVERELVEHGKKTVVSVGIRTQIEDNDGPPIGAAADDLFRWCWDHRHPLADGVVWGTGRSVAPTVLFFDDGAGNVVQHCFHLTPMFIKKDRSLNFKGTIDDDLLAAYRDHEITFIAGGEVAFCEISPLWKTHPNGRLLDVNEVVGFWSKRMMRGHYLRNFRQRMRVLGDPPAEIPVVTEILTALEAAPSAPAVRSRPEPRRRPAPPMHVRGGNQDPTELAAFQAFIRERGVKRYLEIGSRNGDSFHAVMTAIGSGGYGVAVDRPENRDAQSKLLGTVEELRALGCDVSAILGDSRDPLTIRRARAAGPFDLVLIDADHRYEGIAADFATYSDLAPLVALHDVAAPDDHMSDGHLNGVGRFWREIKGAHGHREIIAPNSLMGFGIITRAREAVAA